MRISDWSSDVCSSDLADAERARRGQIFERARIENELGVRVTLVVEVIAEQRGTQPPRFVEIAHRRVEHVVAILLRGRRVLREVIKAADRKSTRLNSSH